MSRLVLAAVFLIQNFAWAQTARPSAAEAPLTLEQYLSQVKTQNPEARAIAASITRAEMRLDEAYIPLSSEAYANLRYQDSREEPTNSFAPFRAKTESWRLGVRDQTTYGLRTDFYVSADHNRFSINPAYLGLMPYVDYYDTRAGVELTQSLWSNAFGSATRAELEASKAQSRIELLKQQFELKNLLLRAENLYWSVVSFNQIVKLQEENVERAEKLRNFMRGRSNLRLVDDVDALQAVASLETRELELMTSRDERASLYRQFNTLRGMDSDDVGQLAELPTAEFLLRTAKDPTKRMTREDFQIVYQQAEAESAGARAANSRIGASLDLVAGAFANGLDTGANGAYQELQDFDNPTMYVGVQFSVPLDYSLIANMRRSYEAQARAAKSRHEQAKFAEERAWDDLLKQKLEAQRRFEKALALEKVQTDLVRRERQRLLNGRTTTFQAITFEQNLAGAQIQRVRAQLALLQAHNVLKTFEGQKQ